MARVYLDTNYTIDIIKRNLTLRGSIANHLAFISPLSIHIFFYSLKVKVPDQATQEITSEFGMVPLTKFILDKALTGPTNDLEDNIQLHSAAEAECDYFLTNDEKLLKMKFFGKTRIANTINPL